MGKMPSGDIESPKVGGTNEAANNAFNSGSEPEMGVTSIKPFTKASGTKGVVNDGVLNTKENAVGGVQMGK